jgi:hypothetical protein
MKRFLKKSIVFALISLIALAAIGQILDWAMKKDTEEKVSWMASKKDQEYGFAFLGSSRVLNMVDIKYLQDEWLMPGINLGSAGSGLADNYLTLYRFYKNGNRVNNLFLQLDEQSLNPSQGFGYPFHEYLYFDLLNDEAGKAVYLQESGKIKTAIWKNLPFTHYIEFNNPYKEAVLSLLRDKVDYDATGGSQLLPKKSQENWAAKGITKQWQVEEKSKEYLDMIVELAQKNGSNIILYTAPYPAEVNDNPSIPDIEDFIIKTAAKKRLIFLNFRQTEISNQRNFFRNLEHLDEEGTKIFMRQFAPAAKRALR